MTHCEYHSPYGMVRLAGSGGRLHRVELLPVQTRGAAQPAAMRTPAELAAFVELLECYFGGRPMQWDWETLCLDGAGRFQRRVYEALRHVEFGSVVTYAELAEMAGAPRAHRATGNALGANPLPIFIPCHRVIRADGAVGGFGSGQRWKQKLLAHEGHMAQRGRLLRAGPAVLTTRSGG